MIRKDHHIYTEPVVAFVTFNSQEGYERCINHMESTKNFYGEPIYNESGHGFKLFDEEQEVYAANEPSNIIWENLEIP